MNCRCVLLLLLLSVKAGAEVRWTGLSGNGFWADAGNWENGLLPGPGDDVVLDNSFVFLSYLIRLPDFAVTVRSLQILPANPQTITLELPITNLVASPSGSLLDRALTTTGSGYSLVLGKGAVFINASGSPSGYSLRLNDTLQIINGGKYVHRTRTGHAEIVQVLSKSAGTEKGIFRFENPDAASTISLSGRVFGSLQFSASAAIAGTVSYSASGTNPVHVRGDLLLETGAGLAINLDDTITVSGNLTINNAVFNLATGNRSSVLLLESDWVQTGGMITETNGQQKTGTILLKGRVAQVINCSGLLVDSIIVDIMNAAGVQLAQTLVCSYGFRLSKGALQTTNSRLLVLGTSCWLQADTLAGGNFVDGPVRKDGLAGGYFLFPVGRNGHMRWLSTRGVTGNLLVEYHPETAHVLGTTVGAGVDHISQLEYWSLNNAQNSSGQVELYYDHALSGGVSELVSLRVASFSAGIWSDAGNAATTGIAYGTGSVTSMSIPVTSNPTNYFTLASSSSFTNVLPVRVLDQWLIQSLDHWSCNWRVDDTDEVIRYEVELSKDGLDIEKVYAIRAEYQQQFYRQELPAAYKAGFCRVNAIHQNSTGTKGDWMRFGDAGKSIHSIGLIHASGTRYLQVSSDRAQRVFLELLDASGRLVMKNVLFLNKGILPVYFSGQELPVGMYWVIIHDDKNILCSKSLFIE